MDQNSGFILDGVYQLIIGIRPVLEALESGKSLDKVFLQKNARSSLMVQLKRRLRDEGILYHPVPIEKLNRISRKNHQGVCAFISPIEFQKIEQIVPMVYEKGETPLLLILDRITDTGNFGAIIRTAECAGVHAIVISDKHSAPVNDVVAKTSAGALFSIPICKQSHLLDAIEYLKNYGIQVLSTSNRAKKTIYEHNLTVPTAFILGNEEMGVSPAFLKASTGVVHIPMQGSSIQSLNVSVASGVFLFEVGRQRSLSVE